MPRKEQPWFRFYVEAVHDRKLRRLKPEIRWVWVAVLAAAKRSPNAGVLLVTEDEPMDVHDIADIAAVTVRIAQSAIDSFTSLGMLTDDQGVLTVTKWDKRQFESDTSTKRTQRHRQQNNNGTTLERSNDDTRNGQPVSQERSPSVTEDREQRAEKTTPSSALAVSGNSLSDGGES